MRRALLLAVVFCGALTGCGAPDNGPPPPAPPSQADMAAAIQKIQDNPNMTQQQKDDVIARMKQGAEQMGKRISK